MRSAQRSMSAAMLTLEAVALGLTTPVMVTVTDVATSTALAVGLGLVAACVVAAGLLPRRTGYLLGTAVQVAALALGFLVPMVLVLGVVFAALWAGAYLLGGKVDRERAERESAGGSAGTGQPASELEPDG